MQKIYSISISVILLLTLFGCSKIKSDRWLVGDIQVHDNQTGQGIQAIIKLRYSESSMFGNTSENEVTLGETDESGRMIIEYPIGRRFNNLELDIYPLGDYYFQSPLGNPMKTIGVFANSSNNKGVGFSLNYPFDLSVKNTNCTGISDSIWINGMYGGWSDTIALSGCVDTTLSFASNGTLFSSTPNVAYRFVSKKNGAIDSGFVFMILNHTGITPISINY